MEMTIIIAKILGVYFIVSGIFIVTHRKTLMLILKDLFQHRAITYILGILMVFGGSALILRGNAWTDPLSIFVALSSWAILIKGIFYIFAPERIHALAKGVSPSLYSLVGVTTAVIGLYLVFFLQ